MIEIELTLRILTLFFFLLPILIFGVYGLIIFYYGKFKENNYHFSISAEAASYEPTVSIVIPTHNEEKIIEQKIGNLFSLDYPKSKYDIIFVDDSTDATPEIIQKHVKECDSIHLIRFNKRMGYSPSMIEGVRVADGEIIILGDAGSFMYPNTIRNLVSHFTNPKIGVVTGDPVILNSDESTGKSEDFYLRLLRFFRTAESRMDSVFFIKGEATAVRASLIKDLQKCFATFDTAVGLSLRKKGYKIIFDPDVKFYEFAPKTHSELIKQKTIRAANLIKILFSYRHMLFNPKYDKYGMIILPMNFSMLVIAPISIVAGFLLLIPLSFLNVTFSLVLWGLLASIVVLTLIFARTLLLTFIDLEFSLLKAIRDIFVKKKKLDQIETVESTRRTIENK